MINMNEAAANLKVQDWYLTKVLKGPLGQDPWVTIGNFDGCHLGHQVLFHEVLTPSHGNALAVTFYPHPVEIFGRETLFYVDTLPHRLEKLSRVGFRQIWVIHFTLEFSKTPWNWFLETLFLNSGFRPQGVCVGTDFEFGHHKQGNALKLQAWLHEHHIPCKVVEDVTVGERRVSSRWIRDAIQHGDLETVVSQLKCDYALTGVVQKGNRLGHQLGFPTANLLTAAHQLLPPLGVYVATTELAQRILPSVVNIGVRPTLQSDGKQVLVESHVLEFNETIYGEFLRVRLLKKLRSEQKFASVQELKDQIAKDVQAAKTYFQTRPA
jgi:riboflavin kinase/FMN adenylyltransferase